MQAVDVVGQAGKPKSITGFATHTTPVLVAYDQVCAHALMLSVNARLECESTRNAGCLAVA